MILVDTSVWVAHLRTSDPNLVNLLNAGQVLTHPYVIGELALGNLNQRGLVLENLKNLPLACMASTEEVLISIEKNTLFGFGIGYVDAHLLTATLLTPEAKIWTFDKRLALAAERLAIRAPQHS